MSQLISIGQLIDQTIELYAKHFKSYMRVTMWFGIIFLLLTLGTLLGPKSDSEFLIAQGLLTVPEIIGTIISIATGTLGTFLVTIWVYLNLVHTIDATVKSRAINESEHRAKSMHIAPSYVLVAILRSFITSAPLLLLVPGIGILLGSTILVQSAWLSASGVLLILLGIIGAIVLILLLSVWFAFVGFELILGHVPALKTFQASKALVKNRFWPVILRLYVPKMVFALFVVALQIGFFLVEVFGIAGFATLGESFLYTSSTIVTNFLNIGMTALTLPIFVITDYLLYDSLKQAR